LVFLWFGLNQLFDAQSWIGFLPGWVFQLPIEPTTFVTINGVVHTVLGLLLLLGLFTRIAAFILGLQLVGIAISLGYNDTGIRDLGLGLITLCIFLRGDDTWSLDRKIKLRYGKSNLLLKILYLFDRDPEDS